MLEAVVEALQGAGERQRHLLRRHRAFQHHRDQGVEERQVRLPYHRKAGQWGAGRATAQRGGQAGGSEKGRTQQADFQQVTPR
ncbi:hypothetical protein D9M68_876600 [compost metagenome]